MSSESGRLDDMQEEVLRHWRTAVTLGREPEPRFWECLLAFYVALSSAPPKEASRRLRRSADEARVIFRLNAHTGLRISQPFLSKVPDSWSKTMLFLRRKKVDSERARDSSDVAERARRLSVEERVRRALDAREKTPQCLSMIDDDPMAEIRKKLRNLPTPIKPPEVDWRR